MAKNIASRPDWLNNPKITNILSVSSCVSDDFANYIDYWQHNGFWFFDTPEIILKLAQEHTIDLSQARWFYYESYEQEYDADQDSWITITPEESFDTEVVKPLILEAKGFDIVNLTSGQMVECSPISCNHLAEDLNVNSDCLFRTFGEAHEFITNENMKGCEPGPYRIISVFEVKPPK